MPFFFIHRKICSYSDSTYSVVFGWDSLYSSFLLAPPKFFSFSLSVGFPMTTIYLLSPLLTCLDSTKSTVQADCFSVSFHLSATSQMALVVKESTCQYRRRMRCGLDPWVRKIPWRSNWQPTPVFLPGKFHGQSCWWSTVHWAAKSRT